MAASIMPIPVRSKRISDRSPFFTVLIPTMNRPKLLETAVASVLWQTFGDFELIVSDNSNAEAPAGQNRVTVEKHANDPRVRYLRPATWMNMPDHWEFASRHASGRYVLILTDRFVMRPSALELLRNQIERLQDDSQVISWCAYSTFANASGIVDTVPFTGATEIIESKQMIREYAQFADWRSSAAWVNRLPRMLNSCYRHDVAQTIRERHGRLFMPVSPDYTAAYLLLAYTDRVAYIDRPLIMNHGSHSNGQNVLIYGDKEYISSLGEVDVFLGTPTRLRTTTNLIVRDLMMVKDLVGARYSDVALDLVGYFMCNYRNLLQMERLGSLMDVRALRAQWWEGTRMLPPEQQRAIREHVNELEKERASFRNLRRLAVRMGVDPVYHSVTGALRHVRHRINGKPIYANVLDAARKTDYLISSGRQAH